MTEHVTRRCGACRRDVGFYVPEHDETKELTMNCPNCGEPVRVLDPTSCNGGKAAGDYPCRDETPSEDQEGLAEQEADEQAATEEETPATEPEKPKRRKKGAKRRKKSTSE